VSSAMVYEKKFIGVGWKPEAVVENEWLGVGMEINR
jgi:hypothetical protein